MPTFTLRRQPLACGATLSDVAIAYATRGRLAPDGRNAILLAHGYTGGPDMLDETTSVLDGSWADLVGPGKAIDTGRWFVVCPNALGSSYGSTSAASVNPATGRPWGPAFPAITVGDIVAGQRALLEHLGVQHLVAVVGPSFGGVQALQWGVDYPELMDGLVVAQAAPRMPNVDVVALRREFEANPDWQGGDYYGRADLRGWLARRRTGALLAFGADAVLAPRWPDPQARRAEIERLATQWAQGFDANALLVLFEAMERFDVRERLDRIRAPLLYVLSRSDRLVPAALAPEVLAQLQAAGVAAQYVELDSDHGHCAAGSDAALWAPALRAFLERISA